MLWNKPKVSTGNEAENIAAQYLIDHNMKICARNVHCRQGEIDLIATDDTTLVFIEVKYRKSSHYGGAIAAVSASKQQKIRQTAQYYLQQQRLNEYNTRCRFDVIALQGEISNPKITWLKNAF